MGQRIGPYEILGRLGSGGMGLVFSAWDARLQRDVAIKILREEYSTPEMRSRFLQEARAASGLSHPNICTIFDIGDVRGEPYLVMELLKGETLRSRIANGPMPLEDIVQVSCDVADALSVAHGKGIIHRDIKPANIILVEKPGGQYVTKVLDFGLAKVDLGEGIDAKFELTSVGSTVGTVSYMSPEQARGEQLDPRSDLFSLGVVLYEMATGEVPFRGATSALVFVQLLSHPPEAVRQLNSDVPKELERVINKLLEKDRSRRFQTAGALVEALKRVPLKSSGTGAFWKSLPGLMMGKPIPAPTPKGAKPPAPAKGPSKAKVAEAPPPGPPPKLEPPLQPRLVPKPAPMGESVLRPVKRIVSSDSSNRGIAFTPVPVPPSAERGASGELDAVDAVAEPEAHREYGPVAAAVLRESSGNFTAESSTASRPAPSMRWRFAPEDEIAEIAEAEAAVKTAERASKALIWLQVAAVVIVLGTIALLVWPRGGAPLSNAPATVLLGGIGNNTGDNILPGIVLQGLRFDLSESRRLLVFGPETLNASLHALNLPDDGNPTLDDARKAAQSLGMSQMVFGDIKRQGAAYVVTLRVFDVANGAEHFELTQTAASREQLPDAVDRLAADARARMGESGDSIARNSAPLSKEASSNIDALAAYVAGMDALRGGHFLDAMHSLEAATTADPHFVEAYMKLADIYRRQHASIAASEAATAAEKNAGGLTPRTKLLVDASYATYAGGDYNRALGLLAQLRTAYPEDEEAGVLAGNNLRMEGRFSEALENSQALLKRNPYSFNAASTAEYALLAMDRPESATQLESQFQRSGLMHPGLRLLTNYLGTRDDGQMGVDLSGQFGRLAPQQAQAQVLDATGLLEGGLMAWQAVAAQASANPELHSAAGEALANAALDRALVSDCATAKTLLGDASAYPQGDDALFEAGLAAALCGNLDLAHQNATLLTQQYPQSFAANGFYGPDLAAVIQWKQGDAAGALKALQAVKDYDLISVTPYLRGLLHLEMKDPQAAIGDFQSMLEHRGATTLVNPVLYVVAQVGLARAYAAGGDHANSSAAYRKFLSMWSGADSGLALVREARARSAG